MWLAKAKSQLSQQEFYVYEKKKKKKLFKRDYKFAVRKEKVQCDDVETKVGRTNRLCGSGPIQNWEMSLVAYYLSV